jgi:hypothetical protein
MRPHRCRTRVHSVMIAVALVAYSSASDESAASSESALAPTQPHYPSDTTRSAALLETICGVPVTRRDVRNYTVFTYSDAACSSSSTARTTRCSAVPAGASPVQLAGSIRLTPNGDGTYLIEDQGNTGAPVAVSLPAVQK